MKGQLKYEGKIAGQRPPKKYKNGGKPREVPAKVMEGDGLIDETRKIGHLMKPLKVGPCSLMGYTSPRLGARLMHIWWDELGGLSVGLTLVHVSTLKFSTMG